MLVYYFLFKFVHKNIMRFTIKKSSLNGSRIGILTGFHKSPSIEIETPTAALLTQGGSVVNLTSDVLSKVFSTSQLLWVPLSSSAQLETGLKAQGEGLAKFAALPEHFTCITINNINEMTPSGHFEMDKVPLWTRHGKKMITADRYMDMMEVFKPDIILAVADGRTSLNEGYKRICKSVDRTCNLFDICVKRYKDSEQLQKASLVGVIVGAAYTNKYNECIRHILKHKEHLTGIALSGMTDGTEESYKVSDENVEGIFKNVGAGLPNDLLKVLEGAWNPEVILTAIEQGWDVFDGSYPLKLTSSGKALALNFDINQNNEEFCILNLSDVGYKEDFRPILSGCQCLACKKHTRAYIQHLLNTREMLAQVLLTIHNLHHFDQLFRNARHHISADTFPVYKKHITKQYELYKTNENIETVENNSENDITITNKKMKMSKEHITSNNEDCSL